MYTDFEKELVAFIRAVKVNPDAKVIIRKYPMIVEWNKGDLYGNPLDIKLTNLLLAGESLEDAYKSILDD